VTSTATNSSVDQVFDVLAVLSDSTEPVGVAQLARTLDVPTSTAHRVLATLQEAGYVTRDTTGAKYQLGLGAQELTHALLRRFPIQGASQPFLRRLAAATGDTVVLTCRIGWYAVRAAGTEGWREIHFALRLGHTTFLDGAPGGRAILAFLDEEMRKRFERRRFGTSRMTTAVRAFRADVEAIRERGYVQDRHADGRSEIALAVRDVGGSVVASIAIEAAEPDGGARADRARVSQARAVTAELEALLREGPQLALDPFGHLDPDELEPRFDVVAR
jgi:DNA-binding IclR family transcriptional regulator